MAPERPPVPGNHGLRLDKDQGVLPAAPGLTQGNPNPGAVPDSRIEAAQSFGPRVISSRENLNIFAKNEFWRRTG
jgi:hypothetical protein